MSRALSKSRPRLRNRAIIDGKDLRARLTSIARGSRGNESQMRGEVLDLLKTTMSDGRAQIQTQFEARALSGKRTAELLCYLQDEMLTALADFVQVHVLRLANPTEAERVSLVAVGGYGRGKLAPFSDIDLLFLLPYKRNQVSETFVEYILYMLWDMGIKTGHAVRTVGECISHARDDMTIRTSLLEARFLWGAQGLYQVFLHEFEKRIIKSTARVFVTAKLAERDARHEAAGRSRYLVEPNIKDGKGAMRDLHTLGWLARYCYGVDGLTKLLRKDEMLMYKRSENFLWAVRAHLHFLRGCAEERLSFDLQKDMARRMGNYRRDDTNSGMRDVEKFMRQYFLTAKHVGTLTAIICSILEERQKKKRAPIRLSSLFKRNGLAHGFRLEAGRLKLRKKGGFQKEPLNLLRIFELADRYQLDIHPDTRREISRAQGLVNAELRATPAANQIFMNILTSRKNPERTLRQMNEAGILGRFITDFGRIVAMMQFNMYHHYTADEHLLRAIGILSALEKSDAEDSFAHGLLKEGLNRRVIYLAVLLHDIAKGRPENHSQAGAKIAHRLGPRLGFTPEETRLTAWLVADHLVMSDTAQRRDLSDPKTIETFVAQVQSRLRLKYLYVLTMVDIRAVGPGVWNGWKAQLLRELYDESMLMLTGGADQNTRVAAAQDAFRTAASAQDWSATRIKRALQKYTANYWVAFSPETQLQHAALLKRAARKDFVIDIEHEAERNMSILTFVGRDQQGLFARLAGACAIAGLTILDARIATSRDDMVCDTLYIQIPEPQEAAGGHCLDSVRSARLIETMEGVLRGKIQPQDHLTPAHKRRSAAFDLTPQVTIDNDLASNATIIEVSGLDHPGLLYKLARAIFETGLSIQSARVATFGERVIDVFYVQDFKGGKITSTRKRNDLHVELTAIIINAAARKNKHAA